MCGKRAYLAGSRLSSDQNRLVDAIAEHGSVGSIGNGVDVRSDFIVSFASIQLNDGRVVDGEHLVGIDHNQEQSRVGLLKDDGCC